MEKRLDDLRYVLVSYLTFTLYHSRVLAARIGVDFDILVSTQKRPNRAR